MFAPIIAVISLSKDHLTASRTSLRLFLNLLYRKLVVDDVLILVLAGLFFVPWNNVGCTSVLLAFVVQASAFRVGAGAVVEVSLPTMEAFVVAGCILQELYEENPSIAMKY